MSNENVETVYIKELDPDIIAPSTKQLSETESFGGSKIFVVGKPGCFTEKTKILCYDGSIKNVEDIKIGDKIMGDDSTCRNVIELCRNTDEMFEIKPNKGESYTVNKQHKLVLISSGNTKYKKGEIIEITVENYLKETKDFQNRMKIFRTGVEFPEQNINFDPYNIGLWLCNSFQDENITKEFGKNNNIPQSYKINSRENRLKLLAGILDIEGFYNINGNGFDFFHKNEVLFDDVLFLVRSLGFSAYKNKVEKSYEKDGERVSDIYYRCFIYGNVDEIQCKLLTKPGFKRKNIKNNLTTNFRVIPKGEGKYYGFTLDGNHRFLLGTFDVVRNTGKSTVIASLLYSKKHIFPVAVAFSGSEDSNGFYRKILPSTFVFNEYSEDQIKSFIRRQKIAKQHLPNPWAVILLDDCTDDARVFNTPLQQGMFKRGRHWSMLYIVSLQYAMDVKPVVRTNCDGIFILREPILKNRRTLWENYASVVPDFNLFCQLLDQLTDDYCCIYISNQTRSNDWKDCVFWYKAKPIPEDWKFGCPEYRQFHEDRFNQDYVDPYD
jgi:hypothetical protein